MMKRILIVLASAALLLSACGPEPEPTMSPADIQSTAMAAAITMIAETQAAIPTATPIPPTSTPAPTNTAAPTLPPINTQPASGVPTIGVPPTNTAVAASGEVDCNQPLTAWEGQSVTLSVTNQTKPRGTVTLSLYITTELGECGYISAQFDSGTSMTVPLGTFSAGAFVDGKQDFKVFGSFTIERVGNPKLFIENERIVLKN